MKELDELIPELLLIIPFEGYMHLTKTAVLLGRNKRYTEPGEIKLRVLRDIGILSEYVSKKPVDDVISILKKYK